MNRAIITKTAKFLSLILLFTGYLFVTACSTNKDNGEAFKNLTAQQLYERGEIALTSGDYQETVNFFEALDARYPFSSYAEQSHLDIVYAYYKTGDKASAAAAADRFIQLYPTSPKVDYVYYMKGLADFEQDHGFLQRYFPIDEALRDPGTALQAYQDFSELVQRFPKSRYAPDARQRMVYLRNLLGRHELYVAKFNYRRGAYVAAINRANEIIKNYPHTPSAESALIILVKANRKLGLQAEADAALRILKLNFPKSAGLARLDKDKI